MKQNKYSHIIIGIITSALTALMLILAFHPYNKWYLSFFSLVPMLVAQHYILPLKWSGLAPAIGIGGWLFVFLSAMFGNNPAVRLIQIIVIVIIIVDIFVAPGLRRFHIRTGYRWFVLQGMVDWVGIEMIRSFIPPINTHAFIAQTMYTQPFMLQPISVFSIYGLGILLVLINFSIASVILVFLTRKSKSNEIKFLNKRSSIRWLGISGLVLVIWISLSLSILSKAYKNVTTIRVAAIQHNFPSPGHQDTEEGQVLRFEALQEQAFNAADKGAQLIVMPELGIGFDPQIEYTEDFQKLARQTNAYLLIGYGIEDTTGWRNEMVMLTPGGLFLDIYGKNHPTSPGEPPIVSAGVYPVYKTSIGQLSTLICNDVHWTDVSRKLSGNGAQLIAVPTLEAPGIALEQVAQSVLRAVENRVAIVKSDVAYASAIIDPFGKILELKNGSPKGAAFALVSDVPLVESKPTIYNKFGDWPGWLSLAGFIFFSVFQVIKRKPVLDPSKKE